LHLLRQSLLHLIVKIVARRPKPSASNIEQSLQFIVFDILAVALGEAVEKDCEDARAIGEKSAVAS
jgi:hypothetical protein